MARKSILASIIVLSGALIVSLFFIFPKGNVRQKFLSPLPEIKPRSPTVTPIAFPNKISTKPLVLGTSKDGQIDQVTAESYAFVDLKSGRTLVVHNQDQRRQIASLTKVMTAIITLENFSLDQLITINKEACQIGEQVMGLSEGEKLTVKELLYGLLLHSANDAAEALAYGVFAGDRQLFINRMNEKVKALKLSETYFANPTGLDEDNKQSTYSTAADLLILAKYAIENYPDFRSIVSTASIEFDQNYRRKAYQLYNQINLENGIKGIKGVKAGYTEMAGFCLITLSQREEKEVLGVILGSLDTRTDAMLLYDYSFEKLEK